MHRPTMAALMLAALCGCGKSPGTTRSSGTTGPATGSGSTSAGSSSTSSSGSGSTGSASSGSSGTTSGTSGTSACTADGQSCEYQPGYTGACCGGTCVLPLDQNSANCGRCGNDCGLGHFCAGGSCYAETCENSGACYKPDGYGSCCGANGLDCVDLDSDPDNCGVCGRRCGAGRICRSGACIASDCTLLQNADQDCASSDGGFGTCCGGVCAGPSASSCGGCGQICPAGSSCGTSNECVQPDAGYAWCGPGSYGLPCPDGTVCGDGHCEIPASSCSSANVGAACALADGDGRCCGSGCADLKSDDQNCGGCGVVCGSGTWCYQSQCIAVPRCGLDNSNQPCPVDGGAGVCCEGSCIDPAGDPQNCGKCGAQCPDSTVCSGGRCTTADGGYAGCWDHPCPAGLACVDGVCAAPGCPAGTSGEVCGFGETNETSQGLGTCCGGACVDTLQDPGDCGACGVSCSSGVCASTVFGSASCMEQPSADAGGFGCGFGCPTNLICVNGSSCLPSACSAGSEGEACAVSSTAAGVCCGDGFFQPAVCADLRSNAQNCGTCGWACPSGQSCVNGQCSGAAPGCGAGRHGGFCDLDAGFGEICCPSGCSDLQTDSQNCGQCGFPCSGGLACIGGVCTATSCTSAVQGEPCALDGGSGTCCGTACADEDTDPQNCGDCGYRCPTGTSCRGGECGLDACDPTHAGAPCHLGDGGEVGVCCGGSSCVDTQDDPQNCGGCGLSCASGERCASGGCH